MNKLDGDTYLTTWEDPETLIEYDLRIHFDYQPFEKVEYKDGYAVYPGCDEEVTITDVFRRDAYGLWPQWLGATEQELDDWQTEILEMIHEGDL